MREGPRERGREREDRDDVQLVLLRRWFGFCLVWAWLALDFRSALVRLLAPLVVCLFPLLGVDVFVVCLFALLAVVCF